jgi:hypothetical protein
MNFKKAILYFFIFIIPVTFHILISHYHHAAKYRYLDTVDPEYAYLYNSLNLAQPKWEVGHTDHPGTSLQTLGAIVIRIKYTFRTTTNDLVSDVLKNPESYIDSIIYTTIIINSLLLLILGITVLRFTNNIFAALFLQLSPFSSSLIYTSLNRLFPETLVASIIIIFISLVVVFIHQKETGKKRQNLFIYAFAILSGLGMATKINYFPITIIPLFLFYNYKERLKYILFSIAAFFLFFIPAINQFNNFRKWIERIVTHTGNYGSGNSGFININAFIEHIKLIFKENSFLLIATIVSIICLIICIIKHKKTESKSNKHINLLIGLTSAILLQTIMVAKHYSPYYMFSSLFISFFIIFVCIEIISPLVKEKYRTVSKVIMFLVVGYLVIRPNYYEAISAYSMRSKLLPERLKTVNFLETTCKNDIKIIVPDYYGCSAKEYALFFGRIFSGKTGNEYTNTLNNCYPETYILTTWDKKLYGWEGEYNLCQLMDGNKKAYIYITKYSEEIENFTLEILQLDKNALKKVFYNNATNEAVFRVDTFLYREPELNNSLTQNIFYNLEKLSSTGEYILDSTANLEYRINTVSALTTEKAFSGSHSVKLNEKDPYCLTLKLNNIKPGSRITISAWILAKINDITMVINSLEGGSFYKNGNAVIEEKNGWKKIQLECSIPIDFKGGIGIYAWNQGKGTAYIDDYRVLIYEK